MLNLIFIVQVCMLFHNARLAVYTLILALMFLLGACMVHSEDAVSPIAVLATNSENDCEIYAVDVAGELSLAFQIDRTLCHGYESPDYELFPEAKRPEGPNRTDVRFADVQQMYLSPNASKIVYITRLTFLGFTQPELLDITIRNLYDGTTSLPPTSTEGWVTNAEYLRRVMWSPNSTGLLFFDVIEQAMRFGVFELDGLQATLAGQSITPASWFYTSFWISDDRFLIRMPPRRLYIGERKDVSISLLIEVSATDVGAPSDLADHLELTNGGWSNRDQLYYVGVFNPNDSPNPLRYAVLVAIDTSGNVRKVFDYGAAFANNEVLAPGFVITETTDNEIYFVTTGIHTNGSGYFWRVDRLQEGQLQRVATREMADETTYRMESANIIDLSPNGRYLAIGGTAASREVDTGLLYVVDLESGLIILDYPADDPVCGVRWIDDERLSYSQLGRQFALGDRCHKYPADTFVIHNVFTNETTNVSLPDGREFWLIMPQQP